MNERIQELVGQAKFVAEETTNKKISKNAELDAFAEKFAELIVKDCLYIVEPMQDNSDEWCVTLKATAQAIKEHFGVEE